QFFPAGKEFLQGDRNSPIRWVVALGNLLSSPSGGRAWLSRFRGGRGRGCHSAALASGLRVGSPTLPLWARLRRRNNDVLYHGRRYGPFWTRYQASMARPSRSDLRRYSSTQSSAA